MSESIAPAPAAPAASPSPPPTPPSIEASGAGPAIGETPPEAGGASPAPAASSAPAAADAAAAETTTETPAEASILSSATGDEKAAEPAAEAVADAAAEVKAAEPTPAPTYDAFTIPDGVKLDDAKVGSFTGLLGEFEAKVAADPAQAHAAFQELGQKLVDFYTAESREAMARHAQLQLEGWERTKEQWKADFRNDPEIGKNREQTTLQRVGALMNMYGQSTSPERLGALRDVFTNTGSGDNIEVLRFVNWAASRLTETSRVVVPMMPRAPVAPGGKAERLYKNSIGNGAA